MKLTDTEVIKAGEQELIDSITADLDWGAVESILKQKHGLGIEEDVEYRRGDIVVHEGRIAYRLDFEVKVTLTVLVDREGNYLHVDTAEKGGSGPGAEAPPSMEEPLSEPDAGGADPPSDQAPGPSPLEGDPLEVSIDDLAQRAGQNMEDLSG